jgi:transcriptional regulator with XRE-family HTH domain
MTPDPEPANGKAPARPDPGEVKDQLRRLRAEGGTYRTIAAAAGLAPATVHDLATGRRAPTPSTTRALHKASSGTLSRARVDAGGTRLRLRALHVMGTAPPASPAPSASAR